MSKVIFKPDEIEIKIEKIYYETHLEFVNAFLKKLDEKQIIMDIEKKNKKLWHLYPHCIEDLEFIQTFFPYANSVEEKKSLYYIIFVRP